MLFVIHCLDKKGALPTRLANYDARRAHLSDPGRFKVKLVVSGPLVADDGEAMIGSFFLVEAPERNAAEAFNAADPFRTADVWDKPTITAFIKRQDNR